MISINLTLEPDLLYSVITNAMSHEMSVEDYIRSRLLVDTDTPPTATAEANEVDLFELARGLYEFAANRPVDGAAIRVETLCAQAHPTVWRGLSIGNRKSLGRVFGQLVDKLYGRGVNVEGKPTWLVRDGKDSQNKMLYSIAQA